MPVTTIQAYAAERREGNRARMAFECWKKLSDAAKTTWDLLSEEDKAVILSPSIKPTGSKNSKRSAHLHDSKEQDEPNSDEFSDAKQEADDDADDTATQLLINAAKSSKVLSPTDIRRIMSSTSKREPDSKSKLQVKMHMTYHVSAHRTSRTDSLVDRGANGGVAGEDVRVISTSHRSVDIEGIDNHQVNNIKIGTVGGVVETQ